MGTTGRQFVFGDCLGRGGFGEVYRATMTSAEGLETQVAIKLIRADTAPSQQAVGRLRDEARLLSRLDHPAILKVHDLIRIDSHLALVTEYVDGQDLADSFFGVDAIPARALHEVIATVARALDAAWHAEAPDGQRLYLVHRDIKPSNIRIGRHGQVKVLDFGIARSDVVQREARTTTNAMVGSPMYMAPERYTSTELTPGSDVFALGCCLFEGLTGSRFFDSLGLPQLSALALDRLRFDEYRAERLATLPTELSAIVRALLERMLAYEVADRPGHAQVADACVAFAEDGAGPTLEKWAPRHVRAANRADPGPLSALTATEVLTPATPSRGDVGLETGTESTWTVVRPVMVASAGPSRGTVIVAASVGFMAMLVVAAVVGAVTVGIGDGEAAIAVAPVDSPPASAEESNEVPTEADFEAWIALGDRRATFARFVSFLEAEGVADVVPPWQLWRQGTSFSRYSQPPFAVPPEELWPAIVPVLRCAREVVIPATGPVDVVLGYRTPEYTRQIGNSPDNAHQKFNALDLLPVEGKDPVAINAALTRAWTERGEAFGMGLSVKSRGRIHVDTAGFGLR